MGGVNESWVEVDGRKVAISIFDADTPSSCALIAPAMGVPRGYYAAFAQYLQTQGCTVVTVDYRGIGDSKRGTLRKETVELSDWAMDLAACLDLLHARHPELPILWIGHSVGGQLLGIIDRPKVSRALLIAAQSGYWKLWKGFQSFKVALLWHFFIPVLVPLFGKLPRWLMGGEDIPPKVALQWARWGRHENYIASFSRAGFESFSGSLASFVFTDDTIAPQAAAEALAAEYDTTSKVIRVIKPSDIGHSSIGHFGAFRSKFKESLWPWLSKVLFTASADSP